jgi:hypothetical protein
MYVYTTEASTTAPNLPQQVKIQKIQVLYTRILMWDPSGRVWWCLRSICDHDLSIRG